MTTQPLDCLAVVKELWDYLDGELMPERAAQIREHLATCTGCHSHVEFCRAFVSRVPEMPVSEAESDALRDRVMAALAAER
jgi:anti-sigma factor (TIGR02949 family)